MAADSGGFNLFAALATLAYDGPRADYAKAGIPRGAEDAAAGAALSAERDGRRPGPAPSARPSSLPTTFFKYATDGDGDGKIDLWHSPPDALASAAPKSAGDGWQRGQRLGL